MKKALNRLAAALVVAAAIGGLSAAPSQTASAAHATTSHGHSVATPLDTSWPT
jgi:hypothetical protein